MVEVEILSDRQLSTLTQICIISLRLLLTIENLYIYEDLDSPPVWEDTANTEWLDLLLPFTAMKNLYLSKLFSLYIARALQELTSGGRATALFPALQKVFFEGSQPFEQGISEFISARWLTNHSVAISAWDRRFRWDKS